MGLIPNSSPSWEEDSLNKIQFKVDFDITKPPCQECGAMTAEESEIMCICTGDKDDCHGCHLWPD